MTSNGKQQQRRRRQQQQQQQQQQQVDKESAVVKKKTKKKNDEKGDDEARTSSSNNNNNNNNNDNNNNNNNNEKEIKPRLWLQDRCDGQERVMNPDSRPCCAIFYSPLLLKYFPDYMEQNSVMECLGKIGLVSPRNHRARKYIMMVALLSTIFGWASLLLSDLSISTDYHLIEAASFNYGSVSIKRNLTSNVWDATRISLGLRAVALSQSTIDWSKFDTDGNGDGPLEATADEIGPERTRVIPFADFCSTREAAQEFFFIDPENCNTCHDASRAMVSSILMSTVTYFFTFTTDVLRIWPNYDVNCQKVFGAFFAIFSAVMGLRTFFLYREQCFKSFRSGSYCYNADLQVIDCATDTDTDTDTTADEAENEIYLYAHFFWNAGLGLIALGVATFAKVVDLVCNFIIPTPSITRDREEQWEYETIALMAAAKENDNDNDHDVENYDNDNDNDNTIDKVQAATKEGGMERGSA